MTEKKEIGFKGTGPECNFLALRKMRSCTTWIGAQALEQVPALLYMLCGFG